MQAPSLKKRLILLSAFLVAVLAGLIFWLSGFLFNHFNNDIAQRNLNLSRAMADHIEYLLRRPVQELAKLIEMVETQALPDDAVIQKEMADILRFNPFFELIQVLDTKGNITHLVPYKKDHIGLDMSSHMFYKSVYFRTVPVWSEGFISSQTGELSATVSVPFKKGAIIAQLNLTHLSSVLSVSSVGEGGFAAVTDNRGVIIAHSDPSIVNKSINVSNIESIRLGLNGNEGSWDETWDNQKGLASISTIGINSWVVMVFQPDNKAKGVVRKIERLSLIIITSSFILALLVQYWILLKLMEPVRKLERQSQRVANGLYDQSIEPDYDEFIPVVASFNAMADKIRKREAELVESEEKYRAIFEGAKEGILLIEPTSKNIHFSNHAMQEMTGYSKDDLEDADIWIFQPEKKKELFNDAIQALFEVTDPNIHAVPVQDAQGTVHFMDISASPVKLTGIPFLAAFFTDISKRLEMEADKASLEMQLLQTQKIEAIGVLAGGIAHDFNNLLFPILGHAEMIKEDLTPSSHLQTSVDQIIKASLRARDLVRQILAFSRQNKHEIEPVILQDILKEALNLIRASLPTTIQLETEFDPECGPVLADATQIHQIAMNIATNAFHAMHQGGTLTIQLKSQRLDFKSARLLDIHAGEYACLIFMDTGHGIEKEVMDKIFDPYFTTKEIGKGTGLGLSVVQGIVKNFNGSIGISSEKDKGTTVSIYLPIYEEQTTVQSDHEPDSDMIGSESILLVDDESTIATLLETVLSRMGYYVTSETSSAKALEIFNQMPGSFDLVISDMTMPEMTGIDLAVKIRAVRPDIPFIICTGFSDQINEETSKDLGINAFLRKPIVKNKLSKAVRDVLDSPNQAS